MSKSMCGVEPFVGSFGHAPADPLVRTPLDDLGGEEPSPKRSVPPTRAVAGRAADPPRCDSFAESPRHRIPRSALRPWLRCDAGCPPFLHLLMLGEFFFSIASAIRLMRRIRASHAEPTAASWATARANCASSSRYRTSRPAGAPWTRPARSSTVEVLGDRLPRDRQVGAERGRSRRSVGEQAVEDAPPGRVAEGRPQRVVDRCRRRTHRARLSARACRRGR